MEKKRLSTPDPHMDGGNGKKAMVYNTKREKKGGREKKGKRERKNIKVEEIQSQKGRI